MSGDEKTNTRLGQHMMAAALGTDMEGAFSLRAAKGQLKKRQRLSTTASSSQDERLRCPAVPPVAAAAAAPATAPFPAAPLPPPQAPAPLVPQATVVDFVAMTAAERRAHMAALTAAMAAHDE